MLDRMSGTILSGAVVRTSGGDTIGRVAQVYADDQTGMPEWVTVRTGLFGTKESVVPLAAARFEGHELVVDVAAEQVTGAPRIDEAAHLSEQQEAEVHRYYGISAPGSSALVAATGTGGRDRSDATGRAGDDAAGAGRRRSGGGRSGGAG